MFTDISTEDGHNCKRARHRSRPRWRTLRFRRELLCWPAVSGITDYPNTYMALPDFYCNVVKLVLIQFQFLSTQKQLKIRNFFRFSESKQPEESILIGSCREVLWWRPIALAVLQHRQLLASSYTLPRLDVWLLLQSDLGGRGKGMVIASES